MIDIPGYLHKMDTYTKVNKRRSTFGCRYSIFLLSHWPLRSADMPGTAHNISPLEKSSRGGV